jgi:hypothetical protein
MGMSFWIEIWGLVMVLAGLDAAGHLVIRVAERIEDRKRQIPYALDEVAVRAARMPSRQAALGRAVLHGVRGLFARVSKG